MEGGSRAGEVRKVHVIYFLSRNGEMEQPHLIRVRHRSHRDGIRLRDVKRWLSELRGKGMPDAFAWSYKRRYKTGYVWQDLADDDLITPVSDNEYVLKGSLTTTTTTVAPAGAASSRSSSASATIFSSASAATSVAADGAVTPHADSAPARTDPTAADPFPCGNPPGNPRPPETAPAENPDRHDEVSPKPPPPVDEEEEEETANEERQELSEPPPQQSNVLPQITTRGRDALAIDVPRLPVSSFSSFEIEEEEQPEDEAGGSEEKKGVSTNDSSYSLLPGRRRAHSWCGGGGGRASHAFRNLLGCGVGARAVDDSALLPVEPRRRGQVGGVKDDTSLSGGPQGDPAGGGSSGGQSRGGVKSSPGSSGGEAAGDQQKPAAAPSEAYKPAAEPSCSQCGKPFKPERLHAHMKSCRALRNQRKKMSSEKPRTKEAESHRSAMLSEEASSLFLLSH